MNDTKMTFLGTTLRKHPLFKTFFPDALCPEPESIAHAKLPTSADSLVVIEASLLTKIPLTQDTCPGRIIVIAEAPDQQLFRHCLQRGIIDILDNPDPEKLCRYIRALDTVPHLPGPVFTILDKSPVRRKILTTLLSRFGIQAGFCTKPEKLVGTIERSGASFILVNLDNEDLCTRELVRKHMNHKPLSQAAIILYKDMSSGIDSDIFFTGINRLSRVILCPGELYAYLADLLAKRLTIPLGAKINRAMECDSLALYAEETLSILHHSYDHHAPAWSLCEGKTISDLQKKLDALSQRLIILEGLCWLKHLKNKKDASTCAACG